MKTLEFILHFFRETDLTWCIIEMQLISRKKKEKNYNLWQQILISVESKKWYLPRLGTGSTFK